jgi:hypothetical protein
MADYRPYSFRSAHSGGTAMLDPFAVQNQGHAPSNPGTSLQDRFPGRPLLAFNSEGHKRITDAMQFQLYHSPYLPKELVQALGHLPTSVVERDWEMANIPCNLGKVTREGQRHHFMRTDRQTEQQAYDASAAWIHENAQAALVKIRSWITAWTTDRRHASPYCFSDEPYNTLPGGEYHPLGNALHSLQDSFAPGHVHRRKDLVIIRVFTWDKENRDPGPGAKTGGAEWDEKNNRPGPGWPGHEALDERWLVAKESNQNKGSKHIQFSDIGLAAIHASTSLVFRILDNANRGLSDADFEKSWEGFVNLHLKAESLPGASQ